MSLRDYTLSRELDVRGSALGADVDWGEDFYALIMVLYRHADTTNKMKLEAAWPDVCTEYRERYNAPQGLLVGETADDGWSRTDEGLVDPDGRLVRAL